LVSSRIHISLAAAAIASLIALRPATATEPGSPIGNWLTESKDGVIEVLRCGTALCGRIVGIGRAPGAPIPTDVQGRSQCGLAILEVESPTVRGVWTGSVTDPRNGSTYGAQLWLDHEDKLHIRGYLGIPLLGQTQTWTRYTGRLSEGCRLG
jgi:uncharacterized protein (DUF2147 family)